MYGIVILKGKYFNFTYASVRFDTHGQKTQFPIIICDDWKTGFEKAKQEGCHFALFCSSGTVFKDINHFIKQIDNYPHQGLVAHIIDPLIEGESFYLDPQCFFLDMNKFSSQCFENGEFESYKISRSVKNIHGDYTPLWIRGTDIKIKKYHDKFGQRLIASQLSRGLIISNWHKKLRDNKIYLYTKDLVKEWLVLQQEYLDLAEQQLWITNNQKLSYKDTPHLISPASGLFWIMSAVTRTIDRITLVDISKTQVEFTQELINEWNGVDYGAFVFNFIKNKKLKHLHFDQPTSSIEKIQIQKKDYFCKKVNNIFQQQLRNVNLTTQDFQRAWINIEKISIDIINDSIIERVNNGSIKLDKNSTIWISNILDYKYTWITSSMEDINKFNLTLCSSEACVLK